MERIVYLNSCCNCMFSEQPEMRQDHSMCSSGFFTGQSVWKTKCGTTFKTYINRTIINNIEVLSRCYFQDWNKWFKLTNWLSYVTFYEL